jgi:transposase-like protein
MNDMTTLEKDILQSAQSAVQASVKEVLTKYDSPLHKLVKSVVEENSTELKKLISDSFTKVIRTENFKESIVNAFSHKVARSIISNNDGLFDKVSNELKQDAIFKSKMALAVAQVVNECLQNK